MLKFLTRDAEYTGDDVVAFLKEVESFSKDNVSTVSYGAYYWGSVMFSEKSANMKGSLVTQHVTTFCL